MLLRPWSIVNRPVVADYPFVAPDVSPSINWRWMTATKMTAGMSISTAMAVMPRQSETNWPVNSIQRRRKGPALGRARDDAGQGKLIPARQEGKDGRGRGPGSASGSDDAPESPPVRTAVDAGGIIELLRDRAEEAVHQPCGERDIERHVDEDHPLNGIGQAHPGEDHKQGQAERDAGDRSAEHEAQEQGVLAAKAEARERIPGQGADDDGNGGADQRDDDRVARVLHDRDLAAQAEGHSGVGMPNMIL